MKKQNTSNRHFPIPVPSDFPTWSKARQNYYIDTRHAKLVAAVLNTKKGN